MKPDFTPITNLLADTARYARVAGIPGVEVLHARFVNHRFAPHSHDTWSIGAVVQGAQDNAARDGVRYVVDAGELTAIPPGVVHAGRLARSSACEYAMVYVPDNLLRKEAADLGFERLNLSMKALEDEQLSQRLASFVQLALHEKATALSVQGCWAALMAAVLARYSSAKVAVAPRATGGTGIRRAHAFLEAHWAQPVSLDQLAEAADMSTSYFCRQFTRTYGLSPHRFQTVSRVNHAKEMLAHGTPIADVASAVGFADQSHLGRQLKGCLGVTPGDIAASSARSKTFYPTSKR